MNNSSTHKDFYKIEGLKFDIVKLQESLNEVLRIKNYDTAGGISHFGAICLNQIPGKPDSIKGNNARGIFWTKPDHTGKETLRDKKAAIRIVKSRFIIKGDLVKNKFNVLIYNKIVHIDFIQGLFFSPLNHHHKCKKAICFAF